MYERTIFEKIKAEDKPLSISGKLTWEVSAILKHKMSIMGKFSQMPSFIFAEDSAILTARWSSRNFVGDGYDFWKLSMLNKNLRNMKNTGPRFVKTESAMMIQSHGCFLTMFNRKLRRHYDPEKREIGIRVGKCDARNGYR